ncbi:MAG TPA: cellulose synthase operon protein YhjQ/BcsQ [Stellaceae bacterium]|jgi:pilus assembly protein CpaE|nr:cellulose synthase operon protein YhjQ/BcsQ [Stellaceae bacterium]
MADVAEAHDREAAGSLNFLACIGDEVTRETVSRVVSHLGALEAKVRAGDLASVRKALDPKAPPDLMLLDISGSADPVAALDEIMQLCPRSTRVLVIGSVNDVSLYRALTALGVIDYLVKPVSGEVLHDALAALLDDRGPDGGGALQTRVTAFLGTRGGIGTTTIAVATAWYFVHEFHQRAALIDLDLHFGTLALGLDLEPGRGLREALEHPERIDSLLLSSAMSSAGDRLKVLAGEESLDETMRFHADGFGPLFELLANDFDQLVIDLPRALDEGSRHVISNSDTFVLVTDLSLAGLRDALRIMDLAKRIGSKASPIVAASQVGAPHRGEISQREFERGLGQSVDHVISYDPKAAAAMARQGKAMPAAARTSKAAEEILTLAQRLSGRETAKKRSILGRLWK